MPSRLEIAVAHGLALHDNDKQKAIVWVMERYVADAELRAEIEPQLHAFIVAQISKRAKTSVTGRDGLITAKALAYAIAAIATLPYEWQEHSDLNDMKQLLGHMIGCDTYLALLQGSAHHHLRQGDVEWTTAGEVREKGAASP